MRLWIILKETLSGRNSGAVLREWVKLLRIQNQEAQEKLAALKAESAALRASLRSQQEALEELRAEIQRLKFPDHPRPADTAALLRGPGMSAPSASSL